MKLCKRLPLIRIAGAMLCLSLLMTCVVSGTLAKYMSSATGTAKATVAKWSIKVGDKDIAKETTFTCDLFASIMDLDEDGNVTTDAETDVADKKIAPGTGGKIELTVENASEVTVLYSLALEETANTANVPIEYSLDNVTWKNKDNLASLEVSDPELAVGAEAATIYWRWAFDGDDTADTALGIAETAPEVSLTVTVTATQKN